MRIYISGRAELVTGPTAQALADAGADVVVNGRDADRVAQAVERLGARGGAADVGTAGGVAELVRQVPDVDVLVNNTGVFGPRPVFEILHGE
ncbi:short-chain dehydrogenase [Streptomyces griseus]|nr:short-chain dehydrogenase [Streptomyces griseus]